MDKQEIETRMHKLEKLIKYEFKDVSKLSNAMCSQLVETNEHSNEALATVGDTILKAILADHLFTEKGIKTKGEITERKKLLENNKTLHRIVMEERLIDYAYNEHHFHDEDIPDYEKVVDGEHDSYLEAVVAAVYYDSNLCICQQWVIQWLLPLLERYSTKVKSPK